LHWPTRMVGERILLEGPSSLCDAELLRIVLGTRDERLAAHLLAPGVLPLRTKPRLLHARDLAAVVWPRLAHLAHEEFWAILMNARLQELRSVRISLGGLTQCSVTAGEAFGPA